MKIPLSATQEKFVFSNAPIVFLVGPQGEGKTYAGFMALLYHSQRTKKSIRAALIRDTHQNIKTMTIPSIQDAIQFIADANKEPDFLKAFQFSDGGKKLIGPGMDVDLFGIDDLGSITKLQGGEYSFIWLEEPAPMFERANAGLSEQVFTAALSRVARQRGAVPRLQVTMNPADEEHWTYERAIKCPIMRPPDMPDIWTEVFDIPYGENRQLNDLQRQTAKAAFKHDMGLWMRYIQGKWAFVVIGEAITPEYDESIHRSKNILTPAVGKTCYRFWDGGHNPTCVIAQITPSGRLAVLDTIVGENIGMKQLISIEVKPLIARRYQGITEWFDTGDPSLKTADDSDIEVSPARVIEKELQTTYRPGVTDWFTRTEAIKHALQNMPMLLLSAHEERLHKALRGGWQYPKNNQGKVVKDGAVKNIHSHPADAISQGLPLIIGQQDSNKAAARRPLKKISWMSA